MRFRKGKRTEHAIFSLRDGRWEWWDDAKSEAEARKKLREDYNSDSSFAYVRVEYTKVCVGGEKADA